MSTTTKTEVEASNFEVNSQDYQHQSKLRVYHIADSARVGLTVLIVAAGITILGLSASSLAVYDRTHVPASFLLPLWPKEFDIRPTTSLVAGSAIVVVVNAVSLLVSKAQSLRKRAGAHTSVSLVAPVVGLIAALVAMGLYYSLNASTTVDTMQSWTCRWREVPMLTEPRFGSLCRQNEASMALAILLVPLEVIVLGVAGFQVGLERSLGNASRQRVKGASASPALS